MTLSEDDIIIAVRDYLNRKGLFLKSASVNGAWTKGETKVVCDVTEAGREYPVPRAATPSLPGAAEELGARALYDFVLRFYGENWATKPWEELPVEVKRQWLKEADRISSARAGRDA